MSQSTRIGPSNSILAGFAGWPAFVLLGTCAVPGAAADPPAPAPLVAPNKSGYNLFNPTPHELMRELDTDRPDTTESPYTVDAGHFQLELSFLEYTHDESHGTRTDGFAVLPMNLKIGLLNNLDLQLILNPYQNIRTREPGASASKSGFGDAQVRMKLNLWGDDGGKTAFALMPFVTVPTGAAGLSDHHLEGGIILPLSIQELPGGFDLGTEARFDLSRNERNDGYGVDFVHTMTLGHFLFTKTLRGYVEYVGIAPICIGRTYLAYLDTGVTYGLTENVQLDAGVQIGLSRRASDFVLFTGISFRL